MPAMIRVMLAALVLLLPPLAAAAPVPDGAHVLLVSVDGLGADDLRTGRCLAPDSAIRSLAAKGAQARLRGVLPTITYPAHATLVTGTMPATHGVVDNGIAGIWFKERSRITGETLWEAAKRAGRSVAIVTWPSTYGAQVDWLVPEDLSNFTVPTEDLRKGSTPGLFDALAAATVKPALLPFTHADAGTPLDEMTARFAAEVVRRHKPQLLLAHFLDYDHRMHAAPGSDAACQSLRRTDAWLALILDAYRAAGILDRTTVFVVSDHGFLEVKKSVSLYAMLEEAGWAEIFPREDARTALDLKLAGGSAAFYARGSASPQALERGIARLRPRLEKRFSNAVRWIAPRQAAAMGGYPGALFVLCARPGFALGVKAPEHREVFAEPSGYRGAHGYCPDERPMDAVFIASGSGVRRVGEVGAMSMTDVGPTVAAFLGTRLPGAAGKDRSAGLREAR